MILKLIKTEKKVKSSDFLEFASQKQAKAILKVAEKIRGKKIIQINATSIGGGVAEIFKGLIPYFESLGIECCWYAINEKEVPKDFFSFTNKLHNSLQGAKIDFSQKDWEMYEKINKKIANEIQKIDYDILVINDPQPLFSINFLKDKKPKIYYNHIDTSFAYLPVWKKIKPVMSKYDYLVFSNSGFVHKGLPKEKIKIFQPAIDPLSPKQKIIPKKEARKYLSKYGISEKKSLVAQISRFDVWKNPLGLINSFRLAQSVYPNTQLALVGFNEAKDNPEATVIYSEALAIAKNSPDIFLFFDPKEIKTGITEFTAIAQNAADIIVQNSIKEGFGLTVTEAMWKEKPVIGGPALGIRKQINNNKNGLIAKNPKELADKLVFLLKNPGQGEKIGQEGKKSVKRKFLMPRLLLDHLTLYKNLIDTNKKQQKNGILMPFLLF